MNRRDQKVKAKPKKNATKDLDWPSLTWDDLDDWAGNRSVERGRSYQRQGRVHDLAISSDGRLLATVQGGERYIVSVGLNGGQKYDDKITSQCTCPIGGDCKHAVATVAAYIQALADKTPVPVADDHDPRWNKLGSDGGESGDDTGDDVDEDSESFDEDDDPSPRKSTRKSKSSRRGAADRDRKIRELIQGKSQAELAELVLSLIDRFPELRQEFSERIALNEGDVGRLLAEARRELRKVASEEAWQNHWDGGGHTPDYSRLKHRMERLLAQNHADAVVELGRELIDRSIEQVGRSHDEGELAMEVSDCLSVVFDALARSSLRPADKILFAIDTILADDYDIVQDSADQILDANWPETEWSTVADNLTARLAEDKSPATGDRGDDFHQKYRRDKITDWLATALENAGKEDATLAIYEAEARRTGSYERLVRRLIEQGQDAAAETWAKEGIEKTRAKLPGLAANLASSLCDLAARRKQWDVVAAHAAADFFAQPSERSFEELLKAAKKAQCEEKVRAMSLQFLETGVSPVAIAQGKKDAASLRVDAAWPLPVPDYLAPNREDRRALSVPRPHLDVLLQMAIAAKKPDDVLRWFDKMASGEKAGAVNGGYFGYGSYADHVADAVSKSHPERALEIYRRGLKSALPRADMSAYERAAECLKKMRPVMNALGHKDQWSALLAEIREKYRNRPRFMELLDKLDGRTILATQKAKRR